MEKRSIEPRLLWAAAALIAFGCVRAPLSHGSGRVLPSQAAPDSFVVETRASHALPAQVVAHVAPDANVDPVQDEGEAEASDVEPDSYDAVFSDVEVERYEEKESGVTFGPMALYSALVVQRVASYDAWRASFDAELPLRQRAGIASQAVMRGAYDQKLVAVWLAATDVALAKGYLAQLQARDPRTKPGTKPATKPTAKSSKPRVQLARNLASKLVSGQSGLHAALVSLRVEDLPAFRAAFEAGAERRSALGIVGYALTQDVDDEALIYLYLQSESPALLKAFLAARETKQRWHEAGVTAIKSTTIVREGELSLCQ